MIYQCYFLPEQKARLFDSSIYRGFGLEPEVNPDISRNCPELEYPAVRLALTEYGAMLHLWRNPPDDGDAWIGFTSYRQTAKTPFVFHSKKQVSRSLWMRDIVGWGSYDVSTCQSGDFKGAAAQAELSHSGIMSLLQRIAVQFAFELPARFFTDPWALYANYWVMRKPLFNQYMEWSWPKVEWCLAHRADDPFLKNIYPADAQAAALNGSDVRGKAVGYVMERLFIIWYMLNGLKIRKIGTPLRF